MCRAIDPRCTIGPKHQLQSLVQHRMPDGEIAEGNVTFVAEPVAHPLGRLIDLGDQNGKVAIA